MKVALVLTQDRGGPADLAASLALEFAGRTDGPEVTILGPEPATSCRDLAALVHPVWVRSKTDARGALEMRRALRAIAPDVVHAQDRRAGLMAATVVRGDAPVVATYHGLPNDAAGWFVGDGPLAGRAPSGRAAVLLAADAAVARLVKLTVAPSRAMARFLTQRLGLSPSRVRTIANGIRLPPAPQAADQVRTFISVGSFAPEKATHVLIEAFAQIAPTRPHIRLRLVGDGPGRARCEALARRLAVCDRVEFTGFRSDVLDQLREAEAFVLPSVNENLPLALLQAMGAGLACLATRVGGVPEALEGAGILVPSGDADALASAMARLADDPALAPALGQQAAARARQRFSMTRCADAHLALWTGLARATE